MKKYSAPQMQVVELQKNDIVTASLQLKEEENDNIGFDKDWD